MRSAESKKQQLAAIEDGPVETPIGQVTAIAMVGIVDQDFISRVQVSFEFVQHVFDGKFSPEILDRKADGYGHGASCAVPDSHGDIMELGNQVVLRSPVDHVAHLSA